jgi:hypothetical protein
LSNVVQRLWRNPRLQTHVTCPTTALHHLLQSQHAHKLLALKISAGITAMLSI